MARTYKKCPVHFYFRNPRGRRQAIIGGARKGAIPPDSWDDINVDKQCWFPYRLIEKLVKKGWDRDRIVEHVSRKYKMLSSEVRDWTDLDMLSVFRACPDGCFLPFSEEKISK